MSVVGLGEKRRVGPVLVATSRDREASPATPERPSKSGEARYRYDLHGILRIVSEVRLPELDYFHLDGVIGRPEVGPPDIVVQVGAMGGLHGHARLVQDRGSGMLRWEEQLGPLSANFSIHAGRPMEVWTSPTLARSPHVLYTNVIEPLLRFTLLERGYMLLHSAAVKFGDFGVLLSARTDTGKTGTVLRLLGLPGSCFLSDDMSIIDAGGGVLSFPKPLTISDHTLRAVDATRLSHGEWSRLRIQSRIHSKEGRAFAMRLAEHNLPIMTINAWAQRLVPPPKYDVQRLVECKTARAMSISEIFVIERGVAHHSLIPADQAVEEMLANTDDAYGFPPYRYIAPHLEVNGQDAAMLLRKERGILASALDGVRIHRLGSPDFAWAKEIARTAAGRSMSRTPSDLPEPRLADLEP